MLNGLGKCRYGICYLSELIDDTDTYRDNPNVIFKSGILHGCSEIGQQILASWIPVREKISDIPSFDLTSERTAVVDRDNKREIADIEHLKQLIIKRVDSLLPG